MIYNMHGDVLTSNLDINVATIGDNIALACPANKRLFIHGLIFNVDIANIARIKDGASNILGTFNLGALGSLNLSDLTSMEGEPILKLGLNNNLVINSSTAARITGMIKYSYTELN